MSGTAWTAVGAIAAALGVLVAVCIAVIVQRSSARAIRDLQAILQNVETAGRQSRRDEILRQLRESGDDVHLQSLIQEARSLTAPGSAERLTVEVAFATNPAIPLVTNSRALPLDLSPASRRTFVDHLVASLDVRYPMDSQKPSMLERELGPLTNLAVETGAAHHQIAAFVVQKAETEWLVSDTEIRHILAPRRGDLHTANLDTASSYLHELYRRPLAHRVVINVVAGVSLAVLDDAALRRVHGRNYDILGAFVMVLQRTLPGIAGREDEDGMSISTDHAIATVVHAVGALGVTDPHLAMRAAEGVLTLLQSFSARPPGPNGIIATHLADGIELLVGTRPPASLVAELRQQADRLHL